MQDKSTDERQLKREIRWTKEAIAIQDSFEHPMSVAFKQKIPLEFRHLTELMNAEGELDEHLSRLQNDLENLQEGEWQ